MKRCQRILVTVLIALNLFQAGGFVWLYVQYTSLDIPTLVDRIYGFLNTTDTAIFTIQSMVAQEIAKIHESIQALRNMPSSPPSEASEWLHTP